MLVLECKQCGYANEGERVYCHNCGAKLDKALVPASQTPSALPLKQVLKKLDGAGKGPSRAIRTLLCVWKFLFGSAFLAACIQMARPPETVPQFPQGPGSREIQRITSTFNGMLETPQPQRIKVEEKLINSYLAGVLGGVSTGPLAEYVKFEGVYLGFEERTVKATVVQSFFGYSIYLSNRYEVGLEQGRLQGCSVGGSVGRCPLPAWTMKVFANLFDHLWSALDRESASLKKVRSIEVHAGRVELITLGASGS